MTLLYIPVALFLVIGVGIVVTKQAGWRLGLGAAFAVLLITGGIYAGLVTLIVNSMD